MVHQVQSVGKPAVQKATAYTPMMFTAPDKTPMVISFKTGTGVAVNEKNYSTDIPGAIPLDAKHYEALLKADANHDGRIDQKDSEILLAKKNVPGATVTNLGINVPMNPKDKQDSNRLGFFFPGYIQHNQANAEE